MWYLPSWSPVGGAWAGHKSTQETPDKKTSGKSVLCIFKTVTSDFFSLTHFPWSQFYPDVNRKRPLGFLCASQSFSTIFWDIGHEGGRRLEEVHGEESRIRKEYSRMCASSVSKQTEPRQWKDLWLQTSALGCGKPASCAVPEPRLCAHTRSQRTVLPHPQKDLLFQLNLSRSMPHVREERKNQNKPELLWLSPWGSIYNK